MVKFTLKAEGTVGQTECLLCIVYWSYVLFLMRTLGDNYNYSLVVSRINSNSIIMVLQFVQLSSLVIMHPQLGQNLVLE